MISCALFIKIALLALSMPIETSTNVITNSRYKANYISIHT